MDYIFITKKSDWKNECYYIEKDKFDSKTMNMIKIDEEELKKINDVFNYEAYYVDIINGTNSTKRIKKELFDPRTMKINYDSEFKLRYEKSDMYDLRQAPGIITSNPIKQPSLFHNGKLDEGAVGNLLDVGLDGAKQRAEERIKKKGAAFRVGNNKVKYRKRR